MARPRKSEERDTRQDILDAALDLFAGRGFFGTSMRDIAKQVGVRESALYHHFPSKDAILAALLQSLGPGQAHALAELDVGTLIDQLGPRQFLEQIVQFLTTAWSTPREQRMLRILLAEGPRLSERDVLHLPTFIRRARTQFARVFEAMMKKKHIKKVDAYATTLEFFGPLMALRMLYLVMPGAPDIKGFQSEALKHLEFFWSAVSPNLSNVS